jgi:hypothetical protein
LVAVSINYDAARTWVRVRATGTLTIDEAVRVIRTARSSIEHQMWPMLFDARSATTSMTEADVDDAVAAVRQAAVQRSPRGHVALVADDDVLYTRLLLYEARCADFGVRVIRAFRQLPDAERWLEIVSAARHYR